jgi:hypothetical protein
MVGTNLTKVWAQSNWRVQVIIFTGVTMGSVDVERFESNLKAHDVKKEEMEPYSESACQSTSGGS